MTKDSGNNTRVRNAISPTKSSLEYIQRIKARIQNPGFGALFCSTAKPKFATQVQNSETYSAGMRISHTFSSTEKIARTLTRQCIGKLFDTIHGLTQPSRVEVLSVSKGGIPPILDIELLFWVADSTSISPSSVQLHSTIWSNTDHLHDYNRRPKELDSEAGTSSSPACLGPPSLAARTPGMFVMERKAAE
ncbi:hypothetical protein V496_10426 [Pseudogymnoascus sp. VKM F-4515 (FW-2607)]|nr:hypothetical protein V496_10426 [Pseudogymnoascus sp. VKM F-4515 (FW-2607)]